MGTVLFVLQMSQALVLVSNLSNVPKAMTGPAVLSNQPTQYWIYDIDWNHGNGYEQA